MGEPAEVVSNVEQQKESGQGSAQHEKGGLKTCSLCLRIESEGWTCEGCANQARSAGAPPKFVCSGCVNSKRLKRAGELTEDGFLCVLCVESRGEKRAEQFAGVYAREHTPEVIGRLSAKICPRLLVLREWGQRS